MLNNADRSIGFVGQGIGGPRPASPYDRPLQAETLALMGRFQTQPSSTFLNAINTAIYRWKAAGLYSLLSDFWFFSADSAVNSLVNWITPANRALLSLGAPTFTPLKGWGGIVSGTNEMNLPFNTAGLGAGSGYFLATFWPSSTSPNFAMGSSPTSGGGFQITNYGGSTPTIGIQPGPCTNAIAAMAGGGAGNIAAIVGAVGTTPVCSDYVGAAAGSFTSWNSSPITVNQAGTIQLMAYGVMPSISTTQLRKFMSILKTALEDIGALG